MAKKPIVASFVEGKKGAKTPAVKSLTPKVKANDSKRSGVYSKKVPY